MEIGTSQRKARFSMCRVKQSRTWNRFQYLSRAFLSRLAAQPSLILSELGRSTSQLASAAGTRAGRTNSGLCGADQSGGKRSFQRRWQASRSRTTFHLSRALATTASRSTRAMRSRMALSRTERARVTPPVNSAVSPAHVLHGPQRCCPLSPGRGQRRCPSILFGKSLSSSRRCAQRHQSGSATHSHPLGRR